LIKKLLEFCGKRRVQGSKSNYSGIDLICDRMDPNTLSKRVGQRGYAALVESIFNEDKRIRFVAVYGGRDLLAGGMKPGLPSYDPEEVAREVDLELARIAKSAESSERWFGKLNGVVMSYKNINLGLFRFEDMTKFLVVSSEPDYNLLSLVAKLPVLLSDQVI